MKGLGSFKKAKLARPNVKVVRPKKEHTSGYNPGADYEKKLSSGATKPVAKIQGKMKGKR